MLILLLLPAVYLYNNQEHIKEVVKNQLSKSLNAEVSFTAFELDLFSSFPLVAIRFEDVRCKEVVPFSEEDLFYFEEIYAALDFWDIIHKEYNIKALSFTEGTIQLKSFKDGSDNYHFWKESSDTTEIEIALEEVSFKNTAFAYTNLSSDLEMDFYLESLNLNGKLWKSIFDADFDIRTKDFNLRSDEVDLLNKAELKAQSNIRVGNDTVLFQDGDLGLNKLLFKLNGQLVDGDSKWAISGNRLDVAEVIGLIPDFWLPQKENMQLDGDLKLHLTLDIHGGQVAVNSNIQWENGSYKNKNYPIDLNNLSVAATFSNGKKKSLQTTTLHLENFKGKTATGGFFCDIDLKNFKHPQIIINGELAIQAEELLAMIRPGLFEVAQGELQASFTAESSYSSFAEIQEKALKAARFSGKMSMTNGVLKFKDANFTLKDIQASLGFNGRNITINKLDVHSGNSQFSATGVLKQALYFSEERPKPVLELNLNSSNLDIHEIAQWSFGSTKGNAKSTMPFDFKTNLNIKGFSWNKFKGTQLTGRVSGDAFKINGSGLKFSTNDGQVSGTFTIQNAERTLNITSDISHVDIHSLFEQFEDFGQKDIVANNIYGELSTNLQLSMGFTENWQIIQDKMKIESDFIINNGRLKNYKPLLSLSRYADEATLKDVQFSRLTNQLRIEKSTIYIPQMKIESNAINLEVEGTHDFESNIDYHIKMQLGLALKGKSKRNTGLEDWIIEEDRPDQPYIWVKVGCTVDNPCVNLDKSKTGKDIVKGITNEGEDWKNLKGQKNKKQDPNEGEMIFEWSEDPDTTSVR